VNKQSNEFRKNAGVEFVTSGAIERMIYVDSSLPNSSSLNELDHHRHHLPHRRRPRRHYSYHLEQRIEGQK
jgi:hypothetical protein